MNNQYETKKALTIVNSNMARFDHYIVSCEFCGYEHQLNHSIWSRIYHYFKCMSFRKMNSRKKLIVTDLGKEKSLLKWRNW